MSNQIKTIATSTAANWTEALTIEGASGNLVFHTVGGTFSDGNTQKTVGQADGTYTVTLTGQPPTDMGTTQIVSLYYEQAGEWKIAQQASRILVLPQTREIDFRIQQKGFGALPKSATLRSPYNGLAIVGETKIPSGTDFKNAVQSGLIRAVNQMASGLFDTTKSPFIAHDRANGVVYFLNAADTLAQMTVGSTLEGTEDDSIVQVFERLNATTSAREFVVFYSSGKVEVYDKGMNFLSQAQTGLLNTQRVVYRRANVGQNGSADTYVAFNVVGQAAYLNASFAVTSSLSDQFYTDASDTYPVLCTRSGRLVGANTSNAPQGFAFYQFIPGTLIAVGVNAATGSVCQFNIRDNVLYAPSRTLVQDNRVVYNAAADWSPSGVGLVGGLDTDGTNDLIRFADGSNTSYTDTGFSYLGIYGTPYASDSSVRRFYAVARPTSNLQHLNLRDYTATIPQYDQAGGTNVEFTLTVKTGDADIPLEIRFPDGVTWTATVNNKQVKYVRDGDVVKFNVSHPTIVQNSFAFTIGRSSGLFELQPDTLPDAFHFNSVSGIAEGEVYDTEEITITGINTRVPVTVTVNGQPATDNVQIFIDGVEATEPFMIANNGKLRLEVLHEGATSNIVVSVGSGSSQFGIYTVAEPILNTIRNWAYQAKGVEIVSDAITNPGPQRVILTLTDDTSALFSNGTKTATLQTGQSTTIRFTPEENKQYHVVFNTEQHQHDWQVWTDDHWLDPQPATQRAERYVLGDSGDITFAAIPDNFYTHIRVPAGILLQINGEYVDLPLDVRGVYKQQTEVRNLKTSATTLRMEGLPSHDQPHTILLGDAKLEWLYDFVEDPTYAAIADKYVGQVAAQFIPVVPESAVTSTTTFEARSTSLTASADQQYQYQEGHVVDASFSSDFTTARQLSSDTFAQRFEPHLDGVVSDMWQPMYEAQLADQAVSYDANKFIAEFSANLSTFDLSDFVAHVPVDAVQFAADTFEAHDTQQATSQALYDFVPHTETDAVTMPLPGVRHVWEARSASAQLPAVKFRTHKVAAQIDGATRARYANRPVTAQIGGAELNWRQITTLQISNNRVHLAKGTEPIAVQAHTAFVRQDSKQQIDTAQSVWNKTAPTYHMDNTTPRWTHIPRVTFRYDMYVGIVTKPKSYPISMDWRTVGKTRSYKLGLTSRHVFDIVHRADSGQNKFTQLGASIYQDMPKAVYRAVPAAIKLDTNVGQRQEVYVRAHITMVNRRVSDSDIKRIDASQAHQVQAPKATQLETSSANRVSNNIIAVTRPQPVRAVVKTMHIPRAVLEVPDTQVDYGEQDPLKQGYFATELDALRNATQVWGHDASAVYGIKQLNGYWTWAVVVTCENVCGSYGCDTRGYLSGG